ncbi:MAG: TetR/AcrR family transcriptional regulator [Variibacter sp.]
MSPVITLPPPVRPAETAEASAKRQQIVAGARQVFMSQGFDAASMGEIARAAGVSKGTLYVYFENKEQLFEAIVHQECAAQAEAIFRIDPDDPDVEGVLMRLLCDYVAFVCRIGATSPVRTVIAIADRMPEVGRHFFESGPGRGILALEAYLKSQVEAGRLKIDDCNIVAAQLLESSQAPLFKPVIFNVADPPTEERIAYVVGIAVRAFMKAYRAVRA